MVAGGYKQRPLGNSVNSIRPLPQNANGTGIEHAVRFADAAALVVRPHSTGNSSDQAILSATRKRQCGAAIENPEQSVDRA